MFFNNYDNNLSFTHEVENNRCLNFLDVKVTYININILFMMDWVC